MAEVMSQRPDGTWEPAVPEPFWYRGWRSLFRWRPQCWDCGMKRGPLSESYDPTNPKLFRNREEWQEHYRRFHWAGKDGSAS